MNESSTMDNKRDRAQIRINEQYTQTYEIESPEILKNIKESIDYTLKNNNNLLKEVLTNFLHEEPSFLKQILNETLKLDNQEITPRKVDPVTARQEVIQYVKGHEGCLTSEIIENLNLDPILVIEILKDLKKENSISSSPVE